MRLLILAQNFPPEFSGAATMQWELASCAARQGHDVTVLTVKPRHHMVTPGDAQPESPANLRVIRANVPALTRKSFVARVVHDTLLQLAFLIRALRERKHDVVLSWSPPLPYPYVVLPLRLRGTKLVVYVQDLFPDFLVSLGLLRQGGAAQRFLERVQSTILAKCDYVAVHSPRARERLLTRGVPRVHLLPLWVDTDFIAPRERNNAFARANGLEESFVALYAGTIGHAMGVERLLPAAAAALQPSDGILIAVVGDGTRSEQLQRVCSSVGSANLKLIPLQSRQTLPDVLGAADVLLVVLRGESSSDRTAYLRNVIPHKLLTCMAAGRPILASCEVDSDLADIIRKADCGLVVPAGDAAALANAIRKMKTDRAQLQRWGENARKFAVAHFSSDDRVARLTRLFERLGSEPAEAFDNPWEAPAT